MFISSRKEARWYQKLSCLKYYNVLKWESRSTLALNIAKITNYMRGVPKVSFPISENHLKNKQKCEKSRIYSLGYYYFLT